MDISRQDLDIYCGKKKLVILYNTNLRSSPTIYALIQPDTSVFLGYGKGWKSE